ncbi:MAG: pyridoxal 5'-phosphate synthase glutaminase subunit PdxT [Bacteroidales bacterium]|nr:pyridoxal 5'-phosphate synthase glutaminase subunit PdxT [Bacteroidales bacterium]
MKTVGVLSVQGAIEKHIEVVEALGNKAVRVLTEQQLREIDALIIPGGESTSMLSQLKWYNLFEPLRQTLQEGLPVFGTCAGLILLAGELNVLDVTVKRNAYGSQINSFKTDLKVKGIDHKIPAFFIRAPIIEQVGKGAEVLSTYQHSSVLVRQREGNCMAATFHPELTNDVSIHKLFLDNL